MTAATYSAPASGPMGWLARTEAWLDDKGKGAWIAAMVLAFVLFWPLGLALLAYMIWSKKMICASSTPRGCGMHRHRHAKRGTGNSAFDAYRDETLRRLEEERQTFEAFLQRLRDARDKAEFDQFMQDRARTAAAGPDDDGETGDTAPKPA